MQKVQSNSFIFYKEINEMYLCIFAVSTSKLATSSIWDYSSVTVMVTAIAKFKPTKQKNTKKTKTTKK